MLRCIFCCHCEEACPKESIFLRLDQMVPVLNSLDEVIYGIDKFVEKMDQRYLREGWK
jgi:NADH-quinone oxidoreductase subunit I